jgi:GT2 family glycosyltransferase
VKIIASLVLFKHQYQEIEPTLSSLLGEASISKVVIVDNGAHCNWLNTFSHEKLEIIRLPINRGFGAGHNAVFERYGHAAQFILICNPDIIFDVGEIDKLYQFSLENEVGLAVPKVIYPDGSLQHGCKLLPSPYQLFIRRFFSRSASKVNQDYELRRADYNRAFFAPSLSGCFMIVSRRVLAEIHGFDPIFFMYMEDVDFSRRVCETAHSVCYCPGAVVIHESQRRSYVDMRFLCYHIVSAIRYFNKWGWFFDRRRKQLNHLCLSKLPLALSEL